MRCTALFGAIALALAFAGRAAATFPGADGRVVFYAHVGCSRYAQEGDPCNAQTVTALLAVAPGGGVRTLARCPGPPCIEAIGPRAAWSPDGTRLAAEIGAGEGATSQIALLRADGTLVRRLTVPVAGAHPLSWLPGGRRLAVLSAGRVVTLAATGGPAVAVAGPHGPRTWSAKGDVAIEHARGIYVRRAATRRRTLLLAAGGRFTYGRPDWSPDGRRLAVVRTDVRTRLATIVTVPARGGRATVVVRGPGTDCLLADPVWSPSGTRLAFASTCLDETAEQTPALYVVGSDGSRLRTLFDPAVLTTLPMGTEGYVSPVLTWQARR